MINLYEKSDIEIIERKKKKMFNIYLTVLALSVVFCMVFTVFYIMLPYAYNSEIVSKKHLYLFLNCLVCSLVVIFSFIYLGIPYKRVKYYYRMLENFKVGQKIESVSTFLQMDNDIKNKDNVDFRTMMVLEWSDKTQEYMQRNILVDKEKPIPELNNGDIIKYVTHANILLEYGLKSESDIFEETK